MAGTIRRLRVRVTAAPGTGKSWELRLMKNGSETDVVVTISDSETGNQDTTHEVTVAEGDLLSLRSVPSDTPAFADAYWSMEAEWDTSQRFVMTGGNRSTASFTTNYMNVPHSTRHTDLPETQAQTLIPLDGKIQELHVYDGSVASQSVRYSIVLNDSEVTDSRVTSTDGVATKITGLDIDIQPGDKLVVQMTRISGSTGFPAGAKVAVVFQPDTDGESILSGSSDLDTLTTGTAEYNHLNGYRTNWSGTESLYQSPSPSDFVLKKFIVWISAAPGTGDTRTFRIRKAGANGNSIASFGATDQQIQDTTNTDSITTGDLLNISTAETGTADTADGMWAAVGYIEVSGDVTVSAAVQTTTFSLIAPTVVAIQNVTVSVDTQSATLSLPASSVGIGETIEVSALSASFTAQSYAIICGSTVEPNTQSASFSIQVLSVNLDYVVNQTTQEATFNILSPTVASGETVSVSAQESAFALQSINILTASVIAVDTQTITFNFIVPTIGTGISISVSTQSVVFSIQSPAINFDQVFGISTQSVSFSIQTPTVASGLLVAANTQTVTSSLQTTVVLLSQTVIASVVSSIFSINTVVVAFSTTIQALVKSAVFSLQNLTVKYGIVQAVSVLEVTLSPIAPQVLIMARVYPYTKQTGPYNNKSSPYGRKYPYTPLV